MDYQKHIKVKRRLTPYLQSQNSSDASLRVRPLFSKPDICNTGKGNKKQNKQTTNRKIKNCCGLPKAAQGRDCNFSS